MIKKLKAWWASLFVRKWDPHRWRGTKWWAAIANGKDTHVWCLYYESDRNKDGRVTLNGSVGCSIDRNIRELLSEAQFNRLTNQF